ncbi:hypothetical protein AX14_000396 [Amanita brunnescens Koide BX004]|nr:hypothetical protein AX14_000396 [Amanita brunnescens Koide BX004]
MRSKKQSQCYLRTILRSKVNSSLASMFPSHMPAAAYHPRLTSPRLHVQGCWILQQRSVCDESAQAESRQLLESPRWPHKCNTNVSRAGSRASGYL